MARFTREAQTLAVLNHPNISRQLEPQTSAADLVRGL
jgi:hypothetical protein